MHHTIAAVPVSEFESHPSVAVVSRDGMLPPRLCRLRVRPVREPCEIGPADDVVLFCGSGMARELLRFTAEAMRVLPPAAILAPSLDWDDVRLALDNGAVSYLLENRYVFLLDEALRCTARGASMLDPEIAAEQIRVARVRVQPVRRTNGEGGVEPVLERRVRLSRRETQLMDLLAAGAGVQEIAQKMFLTGKTVRNYLSRIYAKLGVHSQAEAILFWLGHLATKKPAREGAGGLRGAEEISR